MRSRAAVAGVVAVVAIVVAVAAVRRSPGQRFEELSGPYTASQATVIGTTGRPQLVEFFHRA